jgi:AmmeMemoRadiSam system protein A
LNPADIVSEKDREVLLQLSRNAIKTTVRKGRQLPVVHSLSLLLRQKRGVFVTLWKEGDLRGCIGFPYPVKPLVEAVQEASISAALQDFRFPPVLEEELSRIEIEISVLTPPQPIKPEQIKVGIHGLIVKKGDASGLLLPQVAMDYHWDSMTFLEQTCVKAGLPKSAWKKGCQILAFEAQIFAEVDLKK